MPDINLVAVEFADRLLDLDAAHEREEFFRLGFALSPRIRRRLADGVFQALNDQLFQRDFSLNRNGFRPVKNVLREINGRLHWQAIQRYGDVVEGNDGFVSKFVITAI